MVSNCTSRNTLREPPQRSLAHHELVEIADPHSIWRSELFKAAFVVSLCEADILVLGDGASRQVRSVADESATSQVPAEKSVPDFAIFYHYRRLD